MRTRREDVVVVISDDFAKNFKASKPAQIRLIADGSSQNTRPTVQRVRNLFQGYSSQIGSLRLIARGISPVVAAPMQIEDVEVSSSQQRAATILGLHPAVRDDCGVHGRDGDCHRLHGRRARARLDRGAAGQSGAAWGDLDAANGSPAPRPRCSAWWSREGCCSRCFKYVPLQELGIRFRLGPQQLTGFLAVVLPLCPLIVAIQMYVATFAKSFKEAQGYLSFLMMAQMVPGMMATMNTTATKAWMYYVPWIGQQSLLSDVLGNKPINPLVFVVVGVVNIALAVVVIRVTAGLLHRERIIFGR